MCTKQPFGRSDMADIAAAGRSLHKGTERGQERLSMKWHALAVVSRQLYFCQAAPCRSLPGSSQTKMRSALSIPADHKYSKRHGYSARVMPTYLSGLPSANCEAPVELSWPPVRAEML